MFPFKRQKNTVTTVVVNEGLYFIKVDRHKNGHIAFETQLEPFLTGDAIASPLPAALKGATNALLILPDYWVGNVSYPFLSRKRSLAKAFIERKLLSEHPDTPDIVNFFDFEFSTAGLEERTVNVSFLQDARAFQLYNKLSEHILDPTRVLTPALIWEKKLLKSVSEFDIGGTCLVHLLSAECFLYFFFRGRFLFSRRIILPEQRTAPPLEDGDGLSMATETETPGKYSVLTFEINQSLYLFAQKTKADMGKIHMAAADPQDAERLSRELGREVIYYKPGSGAPKGAKTALGVSEFLAPVLSFDAEDLAPAAQELNLTHARLRQLLEWRPVQRVGIAIGALLIVLLSMEGLFLWEKAGVNRNRMAHGRSMSGNTQKQIIQDYNRVLDLLLAEEDRPSPRRVIINVGRSLPENTWITGIEIKSEDTPGVVINGIIRAAKVQQLKETLTKILENLNLYFQGSRSLALEDINFSVDKQSVGQPELMYTFNFGFNLP
ncbi:MAG: hypothetical protein ABIL58_10055 [Pseudomonadota bacterium]